MIVKNLKWTRPKLTRIRSTFTNYQRKGVLQRSLRINSSPQVLAIDNKNCIFNTNREPGMVMAINIVADTTRIQVAAGYESGHTMVYVQNDPGAIFQKLYSARPHSQPGQLLWTLVAP